MILRLVALAVGVTFLPTISWAALSAPRPLSPANGVKNYHAAVTRLSWTKIPGATMYQVLVKDGSADFSGVEPQSFNANFVLASQLNIANNGHTYYWKVRAKNDSEESAWSPVYKFSSMAQASAATALFPNNLILSKSALKDFSWKVDKNTVFSTINIYAANEDGSCTDQKYLSLTAPIKGTKVSLNNFLTATNVGKYCWSVVTYGNATAGAGIESAKAKFTLTDLKLAPSSLFALTGFDGPIFYWNKFSIFPATLQVSKSLSFPAGENTLTVDSIVDNYLQVSATGAPEQLKNFINNNSNVDLYWRVGLGNTWSKTQKFRNTTLSKPVTVYPANNATGFVASTSPFKWNKVNGATFYKLEVMKLDNSGLRLFYTNQLSYKIPPQSALESGADYAWAVTAYNDQSGSAPSDPAYFKTK